MVRTKDLIGFHRGDLVEARHRWRDSYRGTIETLIPHQGILWLRHGPFSERKLIDSAEYEIWKLLP